MVLVIASSPIDPALELSTFLSRRFDDSACGRVLARAYWGTIDSDTPQAGWASHPVAFAGTRAKWGSGPECPPSIRHRARFISPRLLPAHPTHRARIGARH